MSARPATAVKPELAVSSRIRVRESPGSLPTPHQAEEHRPSTLCYNCQGMGYSKSILLYQDKPKYGLVFKLILIIPVGFLVASVYLWSSGEATGGSSLVT